MFAPLTSGLVEEARIGIGQEALDIGGGSGEPSLTISGIVGPTGSVMYTDPAAGMVEIAQAEDPMRQMHSVLLFSVSWLESWKMLTLKM
jgi:ubiquinone/menaquinone biosynthesis C-methylase UbiE